MTDAELLERFTASADADAFAQIVTRYLAVVYAAARRQVRDPHLADDVAQAVFVVLAKKAGSIDARYLAGWLLTAARLTAKSAMRSAARRAHHEGRAAMPADVTNPEGNAEQVEAIRAVLDRALARLSEVDRTAVALRFLRGCSLAEVGCAMGISEDAARKRVERSLAKLRDRLPADALATLAPSALGPLIATAGQFQVPAHLTASSVAAAAVQPIASLVASSAASSAAKGALHAMFIARIKVAASIGLALCVATGLGYQGARLATAAVQQQDAKPPDNAPGPVGSLKSGVRIELIGVSHNPSRGRPWWRADGSPLGAAPYARIWGKTEAHDAGHVVREVALRFELPEGADGEKPDTRFALAGSWAASHAMDAREQAIPDVQAVATVFVKDVPATVRVEIAQGRWLETLIDRGSGARDAERGRSSLIFSDVFASGNDAIRTLTLSGELSKEQVRASAVLVDGTERPARSKGGSSSAGAYQVTFLVPDTDAASIESFRVFTRPYDDWIEFRDVATDPGMATKPQVHTSESPPSR